MIIFLNKIENWLDKSTINWNGGASFSLISLSSSLSHEDTMAGFTVDERKEEIEKSKYSLKKLIDGEQLFLDLKSLVDFINND